MTVATQELTREHFTMQTRNRRQTPAGTSPACSSVSEPFKDEPVMQSRGENTPRGEGMSLKHCVFVLSRGEAVDAHHSRQSLQVALNGHGSKAMVQIRIIRD